jgi:hypothetical protein
VEAALRRARLFVLTLLLAAATAACGGSKAAREPAASAPATTAAAAALPRGSQPVRLDPASFSSRIDNPWWPMKVGSHWVYRETDSRGAVARIDVTVLPGTKRIAGIDARVVHDVLSAGGQVQEDTYDWYAQDAQGNIWYLGEDTKEYERGRLKTTEGSWQAGVDGAQAGVLLPARPSPGLAYRQEYYKGQAEDAAQVLSLGRRAKVPFGQFDHVLVTREYTPLEPGVVEQKFYASGVGPLLATTVKGGSDREELLRFEAAP